MYVFISVAFNGIAFCIKRKNDNSLNPCLSKEIKDFFWRLFFSETGHSTLVLYCRKWCPLPTRVLSETRFFHQIFIWIEPDGIYFTMSFSKQIISWVVESQRMLQAMPGCYCSRPIPWCSGYTTLAPPAAAGSYFSHDI